LEIGTSSKTNFVIQTVRISIKFTFSYNFKFVR